MDGFTHKRQFFIQISRVRKTVNTLKLYLSFLRRRKSVLVHRVGELVDEDVVVVTVRVTGCAHDVVEQDEGQRSRHAADGGVLPPVKRARAATGPVTTTLVEQTGNVKQSRKV